MVRSAEILVTHVVIGLILATCLSSRVTAAEISQQEILDRFEQLEVQITELENQLAERDERIRALETELGVPLPVVSPPILQTPVVAAEESSVATNVDANASDVSVATDSLDETIVSLDDVAPDTDAEYFGIFQGGGRGFKLADTKWGDVNFSAWTYARYLNQKELDSSYTDSFGRTRQLDLRNDVQLNKVNLYMKGWVYDPALRYLLYVWTANTNQGQDAQVVVAGNISYRFNEQLDLGVGIGALPGTRTLRNTFPYWLKVDTRPIADEFFRPSYTTGIWASGNLAPALQYKVMLGNNLSQLGVDAGELNGGFNTMSGAIWWMPTTGEYGPAGGFGDFEMHDELATTFGLNVTRSREDAQSQPGTEDIQNTQLRLSDGTVIFNPDAFLTDGRIKRATYLMSSVDAGLKYRGYSLEGEYYFRWIDDLAVIGDIPVNSLFDNGFQVQASAMLIPQTLQPYIAASKIFGEYGDPWDFALGLNWFPLQQRLFRLNTELLYLKDSPVGYSSVPFIVGGNGLVFYSSLELMF
jgi:hypothetical protein